MRIELPAAPRYPEHRSDDAQFQNRHNHLLEREEIVISHRTEITQSAHP